jgi:hypothetical protein
VWELVAKLEQRGEPAGDHVARYGTGPQPDELDADVDADDDADSGDANRHRSDLDELAHRLHGLHGRRPVVVVPGRTGRHGAW